MDSEARVSHNDRQRHYFETVERSRIALAATPYVMAHVERVIAGAELSTDQSILEVGSGLGKFTLPLVERGFRITANDLSPHLLERLDEAARGAVETLCCDVHDLESHVRMRYDKAIGFFVLHHLVDFEGVFRALSGVLRPGARIAFCEPVAWNPLYYLQIFATPGMSLAGEPSITSMRPGIILPALSKAGFVGLGHETYGYFPPFMKNSDWGGRLEKWLEAVPFFPFPNAFQIFSARLPE